METYGAASAEGLTEAEIRAGMLAKSREFARAGNRIQVPVTE